MLGSGAPLPDLRFGCVPMLEWSLRLGIDAGKPKLLLVRVLVVGIEVGRFVMDGGQAEAVRGRNELLGLVVAD